MKKPEQIHSTDELQDNTAYLLLEVGRLLRRSFDPKMEELNLSRREWYLISHLCYLNGAPQQQLADILDMTKGGMAKLLTRLEERELIIRSNANQNGRGVKQIYLTPSGLELALQVDRESRESVGQMLSTLNSTDQTEIKRLLEMLRKAF